MNAYIIYRILGPQFPETISVLLNSAQFLANDVSCASNLFYFTKELSLSTLKRYQMEKIQFIERMHLSIQILQYTFSSGELNIYVFFHNIEKILTDVFSIIL